MSLALLESLLVDGFFAALAAIGFAVISNPPKKAILVSALLAAIAHASRLYMQHYVDMHIAISSLIAAMLAGFFGMLFAKRMHCPAEILSFPALLPMIPGMYAYKTILALLRFMSCEDTVLAQTFMIEVFRNGLTTLFVLSALVVGVSLPIFMFHKQSFMMTRILKRY